MSEHERRTAIIAEFLANWLNRQADDLSDMVDADYCMGAARDLASELEAEDVAFIRDPENPNEPPAVFVGKHFTLRIDQAAPDDFVPLGVLTLKEGVTR